MNSGIYWKHPQEKPAKEVNEMDKEVLKEVYSKKNSLLYWFPKIRTLDIPVPRTKWVTVNENLAQYVYSNKGFPAKLKRRLKNCGRTVGYPLFLRTDLLSGKHNWEQTCYVKSEDELIQHVYALIEESACAGVLGLDIRAFVFREFIELDWKFKAFRGLPISRERRYFIKDGKVLCHHPYWIEDAIARGWHKYPLPANWREILKQLNVETPEEVQVLTEYAEKVAKTVDGYWSIDFAYSKSGKWYLIDMARGLASWHPKCPRKIEVK